MNKLQDQGMKQVNSKWVVTYENKLSEVDIIDPT